MLHLLKRSGSLPISLTVVLHGQSVNMQPARMIARLLHPHLQRLRRLTIQAIDATAPGAFIQCFATLPVLERLNVVCVAPIFLDDEDSNYVFNDVLEAPRLELIDVFGSLPLVSPNEYRQPNFTKLQKLHCTALTLDQVISVLRLAKTVRDLDIALSLNRSIYLSSGPWVDDIRDSIAGCVNLHRLVLNNVDVHLGVLVSALQLSRIPDITVKAVREAFELQEILPNVFHELGKPNYLECLPEPGEDCGTTGAKSQTRWCRTTFLEVDDNDPSTRTSRSFWVQHNGAIDEIYKIWTCVPVEVALSLKVMMLDLVLATQLLAYEQQGSSFPNVHTMTLTVSLHSTIFTRWSFEPNAELSFPSMKSIVVQATPGENAAEVQQHWAETASELFTDIAGAVVISAGRPLEMITLRGLGPWSFGRDEDNTAADLAESFMIIP